MYECNGQNYKIEIRIVAVRYKKKNQKVTRIKQHK